MMVIPYKMSLLGFLAKANLSNYPQFLDTLMARIHIYASLHCILHRDVTYANEGTIG